MGGARGLAAVGLVVAMAIPAPAGAAVTIGSDLTRAPDQDASCDVQSSWATPCGMA